MSWIWLVVAFFWGSAAGFFFTLSRFSKWKKEFDAKMQKNKEFDAEMQKKSNKLAEIDKEVKRALLEYRQSLASYDKELDELIMKEFLIKAEAPDKDRMN